MASARIRVSVRASLLGLALLGFAYGLFYVSQHPPTEESYYPKCTLHEVTGLHCPGCGLTRSVYSTLNGHLLQSLAYNLLAPILLPMFLFAFLRMLWTMAFPKGIRRRDDIPQRKSNWVSRWVPPILAALLIVFGILRNIPVYPLTLLAPHELTP